MQIEYKNSRIKKVCTDAYEAEKNTEKRWQRRYICALIRYRLHCQLR